MSSVPYVQDILTLQPDWMDCSPLVLFPLRKKALVYHWPAHLDWNRPGRHLYIRNFETENPTTLSIQFEWNEPSQHFLANLYLWFSRGIAQPRLFNSHNILRHHSHSLEQLLRWMYGFQRRCLRHSFPYVWLFGNVQIDRFPHFEEE